MSDSTPRLGLPDLPDTPELYADTVSDAFARIDAFSDLYLKGQFVNTPPASPADGDAYLIGGSPTGVWSGYAYKIAACRDGAWETYAPFNGLRAFVADSSAFIVYADGVWTDWNSLISAAESSIASAATCDIGAAGALFVAVTGTTAITSLGTALCKLRFLRFADALTLTHDAANLVLPGGANIATAAGDTAIFTSDGGGHWRCRCYQRASGLPVSLLNPAITGTLTAAAANFSGAITVGTSITVNNDQVVSAKDAAGTARQFLVGRAATSNYTYLDAGPQLHLRVNNGANEGLLIAADGSVLGGTTSNGGWTGAAKMEMKQAGGVVVSGYNSGSSGGAFRARVDSTSAALFDFCYASGFVGSITTNGTATGYNTTSDARLKTVLPQQADYRAAIQALWVGVFTWKDNGAPGFGVLAQQAYDVMPNHQGVTKPASRDGVWHASAEPFGHLALWGVKDLYAMVETLVARVATLEAAHDVA